MSDRNAISSNSNFSKIIISKLNPLEHESILPPKPPQQPIPTLSAKEHENIASPNQHAPAILKTEKTEPHSENDGQLMTSSSSLAADSEMDSKINAWYAKFNYIVRLIHWNYTEGLLSKKAFLDRLVEKLLSYHSSSTTTTLSSSSSSTSSLSSSSSAFTAATTFTSFAVDDQLLLLSILFNYLYDVCKYKPRLKRITRYCIPVLFKARSSTHSFSSL